MEKSNVEHAIRCAQCGGSRLVPLTVQFPRGEYRAARRVTQPVRAELKCVACGHRHLARPAALFAV